MMKTGKKAKITTARYEDVLLSVMNVRVRPEKLNRKDLQSLILFLERNSHGSLNTALVTVVSTQCFARIADTKARLFAVLDGLLVKMTYMTCGSESSFQLTATDAPPLVRALGRLLSVRYQGNIDNFLIGTHSFCASEREFCGARFMRHLAFSGYLSSHPDDAAVKAVSELLKVEKSETSSMEDRTPRLRRSASTAASSAAASSANESIEKKKLSLGHELQLNAEVLGNAVKFFMVFEPELLLGHIDQAEIVLESLIHHEAAVKAANTPANSLLAELVILVKQACSLCQSVNVLAFGSSRQVNERLAALIKRADECVAIWHATSSARAQYYQAKFIVENTSNRTFPIKLFAEIIGFSVQLPPSFWSKLHCCRPKLETEAAVKAPTLRGAPLY